MKVNYTNLSLLLILLLISVVIIIYHNKRKHDLMELEIYDEYLIKLGNNKKNKDKHIKDDDLEYNVIEEFSSNCMLKIDNITTITEGNKKKILVLGKNLNNIKEVFFDNVKINNKLIERKTNKKIIITPPDNLKDYISLLSVEYVNLELKFLVNDTLIGKENNKVEKKQVNMLFPTNIYYRITDKEWDLFYGNTEEKEYNPIKNFKSQIDDVLGENETTNDTDNYKVKNVEYKIDKKDDKQIKIIWDVNPMVLNNVDYSFLININALSGSNLDKFSIENEKISSNKTTYSFSNRQLIPFNFYNIQIDTIDRRGRVKGSYKYRYKFEPKNMKDYHSHKFDKNTGKFKYSGDKSASSLLNTYYELMAYNKGKTIDELLKQTKSYNDLSKNVSENIEDIINGNHIDKFDKTFLDNIDNYNKIENKDFDLNQQKQNKKIKRINNKVRYLNHLKNKKELQEDLIINSLQSFNNGTIIRLEDLGDLKKLVLLNNGCLAFDKNRLGNIENIGYIPCNKLDKEQQFLIKRIESVQDYNLLLSLSLEENIKEDSIKNFKPFFVLQPIGSNKCVHINNNNLVIKNCMETDDIKFKSNFVGSKCNI